MADHDVADLRRLLLMAMSSVEDNLELDVQCLGDDPQFPELHNEKCRQGKRQDIARHEALIAQIRTVLRIPPGHLGPIHAETIKGLLARSLASVQFDAEVAGSSLDDDFWEAIGFACSEEDRAHYQRQHDYLAALAGQIEAVVGLGAAVAVQGCA